MSQSPSKRTHSPSKTQVEDDEEEKKKKKELLEGIDILQQEIEKLNEKTAEEILEIERQYNVKKSPLFEKRRQLIAKVPKFWKTAMLKHGVLTHYVSENDEELLDSLLDINLEESENIKSGFKLIFTFAKNSFFHETVIVKDYNTTDKTTVCDVTPITWIQQKPRDYVDGDTLSFLQWLTQRVDPMKDEIAEEIRYNFFEKALECFLIPDVEDITDEELAEVLKDDEKSEEVAEQGENRAEGKEGISSYEEETSEKTYEDVNDEIEYEGEDHEGDE